MAAWTERQVKSDETENYIKGMIMIILSAFFFACMNVSVRLAGDLPSVEKSFFRNLVAAVFAAVILCKNRTVPKVDKKYWGPLILRCVCGTLGILCNFYAIDHLLVADASILNKLSPFFAIFFHPFVKGKIRRHRLRVLRWHLSDVYL